MTDHTRRRMWFLDQLDPGNPGHHVTLITTPAVISVPDTLLVRFDDDGRPVPGGPPVVTRTAQVSDVRAAVRAEITEPFDLRTGPLVRALEINSSLLVLTMHGILGDIRVLESVLGGAFPEAPTGSPEYWLEQLRDLPVLELPTDRPRPPLHRPEAGVVPWSVDVDSDALLAALQVVLSRYTRSVDVPVGVVVADELVVLRGDLSGDPAFGELCGLTAELLATASSQLVPFDQVVDLVAPERDLSRHPLVQVRVDLRPRRDLYDPEVAFTSFDIEIQNGRVLYNRALFDRPRICRFLTHLARVLTASNDQRLSEISMIDQDEAVLLERWNSTSEYLPDVSVPDLFAEQVLTTPDAVAVEHGADCLTYRELDRRSNQLAHLLRSKGVAAGDLVGLCLDRGVDLIVSILGVLKAGAAYVPIDPEHPLDRIQFLVDDAQLTVVVSRNRVLFHRPLCPSDADSQPDTALERVDPAAPAYMIYTSGSTGRPKGVLMPSRCVVNLLWWQEKALERELDSRTAQFTTPTFDVSVQEIFSALLFGGTLVIPDDEVRRDPAAFAAWLDAQQITRLFVPDSVLRAVLDEEPSFASMRHISQAGEPLTLDVRLRNFCALRPWLRVHNHYGPAESHVITSYSLPANVLEWPATAPIGRPIDNTRVHLLDANLLPAAIGVAGQLCVSGAGLASGYHRRPELTARNFVANPHEPGEIMYLTGDLASWSDDGQLQFHGRVDDQVKIRGVRVEPGEVEAVLNAHPAVTRAVVVLRDKQLVAYVTGETDDLPSYCASQLPVQLVPSVFVPLTSFPVLANGKIDRRALPAPALRSPHVRPRTTEEAALCQVFADVLGVEDVGATDDFFALGGHSLVATRVISRVRAELGAELPLPALFHHRTPERLARVLSGERSWTRPVTPRPRGPVPLSIAQNQGNRWFGSVLAAGFWTVPLALRLHGSLDLGHLQAGLDRVVRRHEALRTAFVERDGVVVQEVRPAQPVPLKVVDAPSAEEAAFIAGDEMTVPFDLASGMLLRARVLKLADDDHVLLLTMHHLVSDGWSQGLLIEELNGTAPAPDVHYADFTLWERETLSPEHEKYWRQHLEGMSPIELPAKAGRDLNPLGPGELLPWSPAPELLVKVAALATQEQATPYEVLLSAFKVLLSRTTRATDVVVGTPMANRVRPELERVIGFFAKVVALRTDLSGDPDFREVLRRVRATTAAAHAHQEVPFHEVVEGIPLRLTFQLVPPVPALELPGVTATPFEARQRGPVIVKSEVTFHLHESGGHVIYNSLLFEPSQATALLEAFENVLRAVTADPSQRISEIQ
ncbi:amino acid adenylation domain-containing protein [Lentzea sp. NPDC005914]|uniref:amino acid adenylation domain-containing protein n=1 Tax=Lentzea sp. NPDC005914 TaxID=3154572 RepID=UPI0033D503CD